MCEPQQIPRSTVEALRVVTTAMDAAAAPASVPDGWQQGAPVARPSSERAVPASVSPRIAARHEVAGNGEGDSATALLPLPCADVELPTLSSTHDPACLRTARGVRGAEASSSGVAGGVRRSVSTVGCALLCRCESHKNAGMELIGSCFLQHGKRHAFSGASWSYTERWLWQGRTHAWS
jgi:hypothetical protein